MDIHTARSIVFFGEPVAEIKLTLARPGLILISQIIAMNLLFLLQDINFVMYCPGSLSRLYRR